MHHILLFADKGMTFFLIILYPLVFFQISRFTIFSGH